METSLVLKKTPTLLENPFLHKKENEFSNKEFRNDLMNIFSTSKLNFKYQVVILAAGKGSRMNIKYPKNLYSFNYPNGRKTLLRNNLDQLKELEKNIEKIYIVIRDEDKEFYKNFEELNSIRFITLKEKQIRGTAVCLDNIKNQIKGIENILLFWGDLALIPLKDIFISMCIFESARTDFLFPTRYKMNPYVSFVRDKNGNIKDVIHANEGGETPKWGEQDCLFFILKTKILEQLKVFLDSKPIDRELDFVHFIPHLQSNNFNIAGIPISEDNNIFGLNDKHAATTIQNKLRSLSYQNYQKEFLLKD